MRFDERVAIVTGAGGGLGRSHAIALAGRGAKVVVNDLGGARDGAGASSAAAQSVADEIIASGGDAIANACSVTDASGVASMFDTAMSRWGRVDILVNNAGFLRDRSFAKMDLDEFRSIIDVHLMGAVICTKAAWPIMQAQNYGRVVMTTSSSGLYGNFGQSNYAAAKMALVGLMQTLALEGAKNDIRVNCLAPTAATRMTAGVIPDQIAALLRPETVSPGLLALVSEQAPTRTILCAGAGAYEQAHITLTQGIFIGDRLDAAEQVEARFSEIGAREGDIVPTNAGAQTTSEAMKAHQALSKK